MPAVEKGLINFNTQKSDRSHAMNIAGITSYIEKLQQQKIGKMTHLTVKNEFSKQKCKKSSTSYGTRFSQPKYHIPL